MYVANKYNFQDTIRAKVSGALHGYTGKKLLVMLLPDFHIHFGDVGELIFTALQQILDVEPHFEARSPAYSSKINRILKYLSTESLHQNPGPFWKTLQLEHWSSIEVQDWIKSAAQEYSIEPRDRKLLQDMFYRYTGLDLVKLTLDEFRKISSEYGEILYMTLHSHIQQETFGRKRHRSSGELASIPEYKES